MTSGSGQRRDRVSPGLAKAIWRVGEIAPDAKTSAAAIERNRDQRRDERSGIDGDDAAEDGEDRDAERGRGMKGGEDRLLEIALHIARLGIHEEIERGPGRRREGSGSRRRATGLAAISSEAAASAISGVAARMMARLPAKRAKAPPKYIVRT